jgi:hypothetical protein
MKTSVGFWDALFGERGTLEIPSPDGSTKQVQVTKKWLEQMEREGKMKQVSSPSQTNQPDPLLERAENLVQFAQTNAVAMFTPLLDRFPILRQVDTEHSDFILTVASVFMAATRLNNLGLGDDCEERLMDVVTERLDQWKPDAIRGFEDCKGLFESEFDRLTKAGHEPRFVGSDAVGKWIVWNILGRPPQTDEECMLVRATGGVVTHAFYGWWDE